MSDKELLELAAKAAGMTLGAWNENYEAFMYRDAAPGRGYWNALTDDGDALRLAVKLGIDLEWRVDGRLAAYRHATAHGYCFTAFESSREDRYAATRRAITRAAAEIGKEMK